MEAKSIIEEYLNEVKENIYSPEKTDRFIDEIRSSLTDYVENNPDCDFEDLVNQFGSPEDVAREYLDSYAYSSPKEISKKNRRSRTCDPGISSGRIRFCKNHGRGHELQYDGRWKETPPDPDQGNLRAVWRKG